eukprot:scaffold454_cov124-Isochrysis_galbana.AAC.17
MRSPRQEKARMVHDRQSGKATGGQPPLLLHPVGDGVLAHIAEGISISRAAALQDWGTEACRDDWLPVHPRASFGAAGGGRSFFF